MVTILVVLIDNFVPAQSSDSSFDSLVASQCRARCLSLHPWEDQPTYQALKYLQKRDASGRHRNRNQRGHFRWKKIMEMCSKNENCLQCTLPCDIPTNLLANCKYLCKNNNPLCVASCDLLARLNQRKQGTCPSFSISEPSNTIQLLISSNSNGQLNKCSQHSKSNAITSLIKNNGHESTESNLVPIQCGQDSDCKDIQKCCPLNPSCPSYGNVCAKPLVINNGLDNMASAPFNLSIVERKKGKTIILKWACNYRHNKPTIFVVEGRWSLKSPHATAIKDQDTHMTKWGYLAQTINNNWIILRNINRGRWYKFRVSSITREGTLGYSKPTPLFILSSQPKPPSQPQNLTAQNVHLAGMSMDVQADFSWLPSRRSDLPIDHYKLTWRQENSNSPHYGYDVIVNNDVSGSSTKYTVKNMLVNMVYSIELVAVSSYEGRQLKSRPQRIQVDTSVARDNGSIKNTLLIPASSHSSYLISESPEEEEYEDENIEDNNNYELPNNNQMTATRNAENRIRNLTIKKPYFRNGLVKAKLAWRFSDDTEAANTANSASINSIIIDQPMFTITWFPIKCTQHKLPTPITATTINTHFEIYELKYNCAYVINVRLATKPNTGVSSSLNPSPPQIASAQFSVPSCGMVEIVGRIEPRCFDSHKSTMTTTSSMTTTLSESQIQLTTQTMQLPRVYNIRHQIVAHNDRNFHSVEFNWSLSEFFKSSNRFSGYQISVVPKAIPGFASSNEDQVTFGSVGAIVSREQSSFVVKQLRANVKYIFQIQLIALDNRSYGPASSLEFKINPVDELSKTTVANRFYSVYRENNNEGGYNLYDSVENFLRTTTRRVDGVSSGTAGGRSSTIYLTGVFLVFNFLINFSLFK